jgi:hypothetical protein
MRVEAPARALLIGGVPVPEPILMWWNYVASHREEITMAHADWLAGDMPPTCARGRHIDPRLAGIPRAAGRCPGLDWTLLAAVGGVESHHGTSGGAAVDPITGETDRWIFGPPLDGSMGTTAIPIGPWAGWWGLTGPWQRAVGPSPRRPSQR